MNEVVPAAEVILTGVTENEGVKAPRLLLTAVMVTAPVNPLTGVMVKTTPVEVAPEDVYSARNGEASGKAATVVVTKA